VQVVPEVAAMETKVVCLECFAKACIRSGGGADVGGGLRVVMSLPATTGFGESTLVTVISASAVVPTSVEALAVLFKVLGHSRKSWR